MSIPQAENFALRRVAHDDEFALFPPVLQGDELVARAQRKRQGKAAVLFAVGRDAVDAQGVRGIGAAALL